MVCVQRKTKKKKTKAELAEDPSPLVQQENQDECGLVPKVLNITLPMLPGACKENQVCIMTEASAVIVPIVFFIWCTSHAGSSACYLLCSYMLGNGRVDILYVIGTKCDLLAKIPMQAASSLEHPSTDGDFCFLIFSSATSFVSSRQLLDTSSSSSEFFFCIPDGPARNLICRLPWQKGDFSDSATACCMQAASADTFKCILLIWVESCWASLVKPSQGWWSNTDNELHRIIYAKAFSNPPGLKFQVSTMHFMWALHGRKDQKDVGHEINTAFKLSSRTKW